MKIVDRIKLFIDHRNISMRRFDESIGMSKGYMSRQIKTNASVGGDVLERIIDAYPELNPIWLLKGEGDMLYTRNMVQEASAIYHTPDTFEKTLLLYLDHPKIVERIKEIIDARLAEE
ncbi:hypothetical protein [Leptobacterium sp. I13]|uniref:hypothetical protein n=1 Tax=Leptobacterium meishanense TaxID=3128904 RepID=UPI0030EC29A7